MEPERRISETQAGFGVLTNNTAGEPSVASNKEEKTGSAALQALNHPFCEDMGGTPEVDFFIEAQKREPGYLQRACAALRLDPEIVRRAVEQKGSR